MDRRKFVKNLGVGIGVASASTITVANIKSKELVNRTRDRLGKQLDSLRSRIDKVENSNRKLAKALVVVAAVSTGIDVTLLL